jgi:hypothetical protein
LDVLRPKDGFEYEREVVDALGSVLRAVMVGKLPAGGRGTDRGVGEAEAVAPPDLMLGDDELTPLCGGRGMERPPGTGEDSAVVRRPPEAPPAAGVAASCTAGAAILCEALGVAGGLEAFAGGVIRLTVGREATVADGCALDILAFDPSMLARVGDTSGRLMLDRFRKEPGEILAAF